MGKCFSGITQNSILLHKDEALSGQEREAIEEHLANKEGKRHKKNQKQIG
jgi:hypothetical protein